MSSSQPNGTFNPRGLLLIFLFALLGYAGNYFKLPVSYNVDLIFGSIFSIIALRLLGTTPGIAVALIASSHTYLLWNHPYAIIIFTAEAVWMAVAFRKGRSNILIIDALYWVCLGMPLVALFYGGVMHLGMQSTLVIALKQSINGILNALVAGIILSHLPLERWLRLDRDKEPEQLFIIVFHTIAAALMLPTLIAMLIFQHGSLRSQHTDAIKTLKLETADITERLSFWFESHIGAVRAIAELGQSGPMQPSAQLQKELIRTRNLFPDFHAVYLADSSATTIAFSPATNERGESTLGLNFSDRPYFKQLKETKQPVVSDVFTGRSGVFVPIFTISVPTLTDGSLSGYGLGTVNLDRLQRLFTGLADRHELRYTLVDHSGNIVSSTVPDRKPLQPMLDLEKGATIRQVDGVLLLIPGVHKNISIMNAWNEASYYIRHPLPQTGWALFVEYPLAPLQKSAYSSTTQYLYYITLLFAVSILLAWWLSRRITAIPRLLADISRSLPEKVAQHEQIPWPTSDTAEFDLLSRNLRESAEALAQKMVMIEENSQQLEQRVAERTVHLRTLLDTLPDFVWLKDEQGRYLACNHRFETFFGAVEADIIGKTDYDFVDHELADFFRQHDMKAIAAGGPVINEESITLSDGSTELLETIKTPMYGQDGRLIGVLGVARNITQLRQAHDELSRKTEQIHENEQNLRSFFDTVDYFLFVLDQQGRILKVNQTVSRRLGYSEDELLGCHVLQVHPEDRRDEAAAIVQQMITGAAEHCPIPLKCRDSSLIPVETRVFTGTWAGNPALFGISKDISALQASEEQYRRLFSEMMSAMLVAEVLFDETGAPVNYRLLQANPAVRQLTGWDYTEHIGKTGSELFFGWPDEVLKKYFDVALTGTPYQYTRYNPKFGQHFEVKVFSPKKGQFALLFNDITEQKQNEAKMFAAVEAAKVAEQAKSHFLATVAHEFRTPLGLLAVNAGILKNYGLRITPAEMETQLEEISQSVARLSRLVESVLAFNQSGAEDLVLIPVSVNICATCTELAAGIKALFGDSHNLKVQVAAACGNIRLDEQLFRQIVENLLVNAFRYTPEGGQITLEAGISERHLIIAVSDNGIGIPEEDQPHIFKPFYQAGNTGNRRGLGLGLSIVQQSATRMGGTVFLQSTPESGTVVTLQLPLDETAPEEKTSVCTPS